MIVVVVLILDLTLQDLLREQPFNQESVNLLDIGAVVAIHLGEHVSHAINNNDEAPAGCAPCLL